jgi:hypothetical protein
LSTQVRAFFEDRYQRRKPIKSAPYLKYIRSLECLACGGTRRVEAAHIGPKGLGQKRDDKDALPLCVACHRELHEVGPTEFTAKYVLDFEAGILKYNLFFEQTVRGTY